MKRKFYTETWFLWLMLFVFAPVGIILLVKYHKDKGSELKKALISVIFIFVFFIQIVSYLGIAISSNQKVTPTSPKKSVQKTIYKKLSTSDRELLKMKYSDFNDDEKTQFSKIEDEFGELSSKDQASISDNYRRLENEKEDAEAAKNKADQNDNTQNSSTNQPAQQKPQQQQNSTDSQPQQNQQQSQQQNSQPTSQPVQQPAQDQNQSQTVYVTDTGKKYHRDGCKYLRKSQIPITLKDAKAQGYEPCSICNP